MKEIKIDDYQPLLKACERYKWEIESDNEKLFKNINVRIKNDLYLYNYNNFVLVPRNHPVLMKCRGLVLNKEGKIINFPFERFFNDFEKEKDIINFDKAKILEKVDGSLISLFWNGEWIVTTRGSFYPIENQVNYEKIFWQTFNKLGLKKENLKTGFSYIFELVTDQNRIVKWYNEEHIYLIGMRKISFQDELGQDELDFHAHLLKAERPKYYFIKNLEEVKELFKDFKDDDEGIVIIDESQHLFKRIKIKQESYFKLAKIIALKEQDILDYILGLTELDEEYIQKIDDVKDKVIEIRHKVDVVNDHLLKTFDLLKVLPTRKDFALEAIKYPYSGLLFLLLDDKSINQKINYILLEKCFKFIKGEKE